MSQPTIAGKLDTLRGVAPTPQAQLHRDLIFIKFGTRVGLQMVDGTRRSGWFIGYDRDDRNLTIIPSPANDNPQMPAATSANCVEYQLAQVAHFVTF